MKALYAIGCFQQERTEAVDATGDAGDAQSVGVDQLDRLVLPQMMLLPVLAQAGKAALGKFVQHLGQLGQQGTGQLVARQLGADVAHACGRLVHLGRLQVDAHTDHH